MKKIGIGFLVTIFLVGMTGCGCSKANEPKPEENKTHGNTNEGVIKDQELGSLKFTNTALVMEDGMSKLTTLVTNNSDEDIQVETFDITVKDVDGNTIVVLQGYVGGVVPKRETREVVTECSIDLSHATNIEYSIRNE